MKDGGPAFPITAEQSSSGMIPMPGMSLRDYFAGLAMQGLIASGADANRGHDGYMVTVAKLAFRYADAMLAERDKEDTK